MYTRCRYTGAQLLKSGLKLIGGKAHTRDIFYALRPLDASRYIEPFLGTGNVWVGLPRFPKEYVGDVNEHVINFFSRMQTEPESLWDLLQRAVPLVRKFGEEFWRHLRDWEPKEPLNNAAWFYIVTKFAMNGIVRLNKKGRCNSSWCKTTEGRGIYNRRWFDAVCERVRSAHMQHCDYRKLLVRYDAASAWAFIDPPYRKCQTTYNGIAFSDEDHQELRDLLAGLRCRWLLTINDDDFTRDLYKDFNIISHEIFYSCSQTPAGRSARPELIVTNYQPPALPAIVKRRQTHGNRL